MRPRSCFVQMWISNDKGEKACYSLRPLPSDELGQSAAGFFLTKLLDRSVPSPVYAVRVEVGGMVSCNCPQFGIANQCKHADSLVASGVLPVGLLAVLQSRTKVLDEVEVDAKRQAATVANLQSAVATLTEQRTYLEQLLEEAQDLIVRLEKPKAHRVARAKAA